MKQEIIPHGARSWSVSSWRYSVVLWIAAAVLPALAADEAPFQVQLKSDQAQLGLRWPARWPIPAGLSMHPSFQVLSSQDLSHWTPISGIILDDAADADHQLNFVVPPDRPQAFFKVAAKVDNVSITKESVTGADVLGYAAAFENALAQVGQISPEAFASRFPVPTNYLPQISWDPTTAQYWEKFSGYSAPFWLNTNEIARLKQNGFVASERLGGRSTTELFYRIYHADQPVFVSSDAILQAWHQSFDSMLEEMEEAHLKPTLEQVLNGMAGQLPATWNQGGTGPLQNSLMDADYFLTVARCLISGTNVASFLNQNTRVAGTLLSINSLNYVEFFDLFGTMRSVDFSQFKVRGHYDHSEALRRYFRAMMWCGRIDMRVAGGNTDLASTRELGTAVVLTHLLAQAGYRETWREFDRLLQFFVGRTDSMTPGQMSELLEAAQIGSMADVSSPSVLTNLQWRILTGTLGVQNIRGDAYMCPLGSEQLVLPRSFTLAGQKFTVDSWALSQNVYDSILLGGNKVNRRIPSCLDVAFAVLGNDQVVPDLCARAINPVGRAFRDGLPYLHNLAATRQVIDQHTPQAWKENIYMGWLAALRELSPPTTDLRFPESMRTRAWAMKGVNTQMASWTHLRHDTILYVKQSYTGVPICSYPYGFVEPVPAFWERMRMLTDLSANLIRQLHFQGTNWVDNRSDMFQYQIPVNLAALQTGYVSFLESFSTNLTLLQGIAEQELAHLPLTTNQESFLKNLVENQSLVLSNLCGGGDSATLVRYSGWYPSLFYASVFDRDQVDPFVGPTACTKWDALVADVHTDVPDLDSGDPGCILHEGVGDVDLLVIAVDNGPDRMIYAGPVLSHYEFEMPFPQRKSDSEWQADIKSATGSTTAWLPARPEWTRAYLVPRR